MIAAEGVPCIVVGASGFVGRHLVQDLAESWQGPVVAVTRRDVAFPHGVAVQRAALDAPQALARTVPAGGVVVNLVYGRDAGLAGNLALIDQVTGLCDATRARRLVHVSTATVAGVTGRTVIDEETPCVPASAYQQEKLAVEHRLADWASSARALVVLRPTAVFGQGGLALRKLAVDLRRQSGLVSYAKACLSGRRPLNLVAVDTVVAAIRFAATSERAPGDGVYLVSEDDAPENNYREVESVMRQALGFGRYPVPPVPVPRPVLAAVLRAAGRRSLDVGARFSADRLRQAGCAPPRPFHESLTTYAAHLAAEVRSGAVA